VAKLFPPDGVLRRTDKATKAAYISKRCNAVAGYSVQEALLTFSYDLEGKAYKYGVSDLRYDINCGLLVLETDDARKEEAAKQRSKESPLLANATTTLSTSRTHAAAAKTCKAVGKHVKGRVGAFAKAVRSRAREKALVAISAGPSDKIVVPVSGTSSSSCSAGSAVAWWSSVALRHIQKCVFGPLKKRAACGQADETAMFTLLGVGYELGMDPSMLNVMQEILRKEPSARGEFGEMVLQHFESALSKRI